MPVIATAFFAYFGFHAVNGTYGLNSKMHLENRAMELRAELADLSGQRKALERRVELMGDKTLDRDLLDERARLLLNVARPDEIIIFR